ncbi:trypsin-like peptidase domain-containing protein [Cyanobium sp. FGCU-52]|nr:trypsin-like peptidase domain-containing protein [Cyanobium sp. FGCU52]
MPRLPDTAAAALPGEEVVRRVAAAVVAVELPDGSGGGILLNRSGVIATMQHVVEGWSNARIRWRNGRVSTAWVARSWREHDLAFLLLEPDDAAAAAERVPHPLMEGEASGCRRARSGETVYVIGHPLGLAYSVTRGVVSAAERHIDGGTYLQIDAPINPGNSGGPVLDAHGVLLGIVASSRLEAEGLNFAVPAWRIHELLQVLREERRQGARRYCTVCGAASRDTTDCDHCGALLALVDAVAELEAMEQRQTAAEAAAAGEPASAAEAGEAEPPAAVVCPVCGAQNAPGEPYCSRCGATL